MSKLSIAAKLGIDTKDYEAGIQRVTQKTNNLKGSVNNSKNELSAFGSAFSDVGKNIIGIDGTLSNVVGTTSNLVGSVKNFIGNFGKGLTSLVGGVVGGIQSMFTGIVAFMKGVTVAIASTGVGAIILAIVAAIASFVTWLKRSDEGIQTLRRAMNQVKAVIEAVLDTLSALGSAIVKIFKGDFKGAVEEAKTAISGFSKKVEENIERANEITKLQNAYEDFGVTYELNLAKINVRLSEQQRIMRDEVEYTAPQRYKALQDYKKTLEEEIALKRKDLQFQIDIMEKQQAQGYSSKEDIKQLNSLKAQLINLEAEYQNKLRETNKVAKKLNDELFIKPFEYIENKTKKVFENINKQDESLFGDLFKDGINELDEAMSEAEADLNKRVPQLLTPFEALKEINPIKGIGIEIKNTFNDITQVTVTTMQTISSSIGSVFDTFRKGASSVKEYATNLKAALKNAISAIIGEAVITMVAAQLKKFAWLNPLVAMGFATAAGGLATTMFNQLTSKLGFETGGIVPYNYYSGDRVPIYANSGEMILNTAQQRNLFNILNSARGINSGVGEVRFEIEGDKLVGVLNNYSKIQKRL